MKYRCAGKHRCYYIYDIVIVIVWLHCAGATFILLNSRFRRWWPGHPRMVERVEGGVVAMQQRACYIHKGKRGDYIFICYPPPPLFLCIVSVVWLHWIWHDPVWHVAMKVQKNRKWMWGSEMVLNLMDEIRLGWWRCWRGACSWAMVKLLHRWMIRLCPRQGVGFRSTMMPHHSMCIVQCNIPRPSAGYLYSPNNRVSMAIMLVYITTYIQ